MPNFFSDNPNSGDELVTLMEQGPRHLLKLAGWLVWAIRPSLQKFQHARQEAALRAAVERMQNAGRTPAAPTPPPPTSAVAQPNLTKPPKRPGFAQE